MDGNAVAAGHRLAGHTHQRRLNSGTAKQIAGSDRLCFLKSICKQNIYHYSSSKYVLILR